MTSKTRESNIELLRIFTICGVVVLHYNGNVAFSLVEENSLNYYLLYVLEGLFICSVNLFVLISGYFLCNSGKRRTVKVLELIVQVIVMNAAKYLMSSFVTGEEISLYWLARVMIPNNYFVTLYLTLYLLSPYINLALNRVKREQFRVLIGLCLGLFSVWPTILDLTAELTGNQFAGLYPTNTAGSQNGYSLLNFGLMYLIGAYLRRVPYDKCIKKKILLSLVAACVSVLFVWQLYFPQTSRAYSNPIVIAIAILIFLLFKNIRLCNRFVNELAKGVFTCFLMHDFFLWYIGIGRVVNGNPLLLVGHILLTLPLIFLACWVIWKLYSWVTAPVLKWIGNKVSFLDRLISVE